ncbi:MAG TPA: DUF4260 domain-containing protein [Candidatus Binatia bacterium]|jgi:hypothetical protein
MEAIDHDDGVVRGLPRLLLRTEGGVLLAASALLYAGLGVSWTAFVVLLLVPDVAMLGYLHDTRLGAFFYNLTHTYAPPALLALIATLNGSRAAYAGALIWLAHIGMDRLLGYGLKYPTSFHHTHLGRIGTRRGD